MITGVAIRKGIIVVHGAEPCRHHHLLRNVPDPHEWEQGFTDDTRTFYTRRAAAVLALRSGQVKHLAHKELFSEDLW